MPTQNLPHNIGTQNSLVQWVVCIYHVSIESLAMQTSVRLKYLSTWMERINR